MCRSYLYLYGLMAIYLTSCETQSTSMILENSAESVVRDILQKALAKAGGMASYAKLAKLKFDKITNVYDSIGTLESHTEQHHRYHYHPKHILEILWQDEGGDHQLIARDWEVKKYLNGKPDPEYDLEKGKQNILAAEYAVLMPFKLLDPGMILQYEGIDTLGTRTLVHVIRTHYQPTENTIYNTSDIWWHYFNVEHYLHEGYKVKHADHYNLVINDDFQEIEEFLLPAKRTSYRVDADGKPLYLRADFKYSNYYLRKSDISQD